MPSSLLDAAADLPSFRVVPAGRDVRPEDLTLPDGTRMVGEDGLLIPPARSFSMVVNAATRVYSHRFDEAMRDNLANARAMRRDAFIRSLLEERILPTINRKWQLEIDDDRDPEQVRVRDALTRVIQGIPDFDAFQRALLDGVWFGRAGCQWAYRRDPDLDNMWGLSRWDPVHGDSMQFTYDGVPAVLLDSTVVGWYAQHGARFGPPGTGDLVPTDRGGTALVLHRPYWRDRFAVHVHMREKADYFEGELAGSVQGLGLRGLVYWQYVVRTDALTWMLAYMQAVGQMDLLVFNYPAGNAAAEAQQKANAQKVMGKAAIACPRNPAGNWPAVEQIPMNEAGLKALHELVADYFDRHIERLIVGQSMSAGEDHKDGLGGSGRAAFAMATKDEILQYDTTRRDSTMSRDVVGPLKRYNFPRAKFPVRFKSVMPDLEKSERVKNGQVLIQSGVEIKKDEFREAAGYSRPEEGDETVGAQQPGMPGAGGPGGQPGPGQPPPPAPPTPFGVPAAPQPAPAPLGPPAPPSPTAKYTATPNPAAGQYAGSWAGQNGFMSGMNPAPLALDGGLPPARLTDHPAVRDMAKQLSESPTGVVQYSGHGLREWWADLGYQPHTASELENLIFTWTAGRQGRPWAREQIEYHVGNGTPLGRLVLEQAALENFLYDEHQRLLPQKAQQAAQQAAERYELYSARDAADQSHWPGFWDGQRAAFMRSAYQAAANAGKLYRRGPTGNTVEEWHTSPPPQGYDCESTVADLRRRGYYILGGVARPWGRQGDNELTMFNPGLIAARAAAPATYAGVGMGFPGGSNTHLPGFDHTARIGFTRYEDPRPFAGGGGRPPPAGYATDAAGHEHGAGGRFVSHGGVSAPLPHPEQWLGTLNTIWGGIQKEEQARVEAAARRAGRPLSFTPRPMDKQLLGLCLHGSVALREQLGRAGVPTRVVAGSHRADPHGAHVWLQTPDGTVIDPTESQYRPGVAAGEISVHPPGSPGAGDYSESPSGGDFFDNPHWVRNKHYYPVPVRNSRHTPYRTDRLGYEHVQRGVPNGGQFTGGRSMPLGYVTDAAGHEHRGPGPGGGQFAHKAETTEAGVSFSTGRPVSFPFLRNTARAPRPPAGTDPYQQAIEPHGRYLSHDSGGAARSGTVPPGWESGHVTFRNPLVVALNAVPGGRIYDNNSWKVLLSRHFGSVGAELSRAVAAAGHDGIVTVDENGNTSEIVDLSHLHRAAQTDYETAHAPPGGASVAGRQFRGGEFIPADVMAAASPAERARIGEKSQPALPPAPPPRPDPAAAPHADSLARAVPVKRLHHGVDLRRDANGNHWVVKGRAGKAAAVANEAAASALAEHAGLNVPRVHHVKLNGQDHAAVAPVDAVDLSRHPNRRDALASVPQAQIDGHALFDYVIGSTDPNNGNFMISSSGDLVAIDKEKSLSFGQGQKAGYAWPFYLDDVSHTGNGADHQFDARAVSDMAAAAERMAVQLEQSGRRGDAAGVRRRAGVLKQLAGSGQAVTPAAIDRAGREADRSAPAGGAFGWVRKLFGG